MSRRKMEMFAKCNNWRNKNFSQFLTFRIRNWKKKKKEKYVFE